MLMLKQSRIQRPEEEQLLKQSRSSDRKQFCRITRHKAGERCHNALGCKRCVRATMMEAASSGRRPQSAECPKATGLSPKEGPPGTKITIRGENLGNSPQDLIGVEICGINCLMYSDWKSSSKILTRSGRCKGLGDVIVTTKSGGRGTCTVQFKGYEDIITPTKDSAVWINEDDHFVITNSRHRSVSSPTLYLQEPLGLCPDEESPTNVRSKLSESLFKELFPECEGVPDKGYSNILSENFIPPWYLLENHSKASFQDLKKGLVSLRQRVDGKSAASNVGPLTLLKPNVLAVIECLDALKAVQKALKKDKQDIGTELMTRIEESIRKAAEEAHEIFDSVLSRKETVDSTRNALNVLQRYRFLFNLPSSIERNIHKEDYDVVINDYSRAKSLFSDTQVKVFQKVYAEVEQRISGIRKMLGEKLTSICNNQEPRNIEEVKKLIRYLINLEAPGNPGWDSVVAIKDNLFTSMNNSCEKHLSAARAPKVSVTESDEDFITAEAPQAVQFLEEITCLFNQTFSDLMKLGSFYLSGELRTKENDEQLAAKEKLFNSEMVHKPVQLVVNLMRSALLPNSVKNIPSIEPWPQETSGKCVIWLPHCLHIITDFYEELQKQELPASSLQLVQQLIVDVKIDSLICLFSQASEEVKQLSRKENWDIHLDDATGSRTQLPLLFESKVVEILQLVRDTILQPSVTGEVDVFSKINVQGQMKQLAQSLLQAFVVALETTVTSHTTSPTVVLKSDPSKDHRILMVICNCTFTTNHVMPRLHEAFEKYNYPSMSAVIKVAQSKYKELENKLFDEYIEKKCDAVIGGIETSMYLLGKEWYSSQVKPTDISFYVKEILMNVIEVQAEVFSIAPPLVRKVMAHVIDSALEETARLYACFADRMSEAGNLQATLDLCALKYVFDNPLNYKSLKAEKMLSSCQAQLRPLTQSKDNQIVNHLMNHFKTCMRLQLACCNWQSEQTVIII